MDTRHEFFHEPGADRFWSESYYLDFVDEAVQGYVRVGAYPNRDRANVFAFLLDDAAVYSVVEEDLDPAAVHGLTVDGDGWELSLTPVEVGRTWRVRFEGGLLRSETARAVAERAGEPATASLSVTARGRGEPYLYSEGDDDDRSGEDRYEQATRVTGEATLDGTTYEVDAPGERDHSWGPRRWTDGEWLWVSGGFEDGTAYNHLSAWPPGAAPGPDGTAELPVQNGFWYDGDRVRRLTGATVAAAPGLGRETASAWLDGDPPSVEVTLRWADGEATVTVDPFATTPVEWTGEDARAVMTRSPARQRRADGTEGRGFVENTTQFGGPK